MAPPRKYKTAESLKAAVDAYFAKFDPATKDSIPTWADMADHLGITEQTIRNYGDEDKYPGYLAAIKRAEGHFSTYWQRFGAAHPNLQSYAMFMLKQVRYGGFSDRPQDTGQAGEVTIKVQIDGLAAKANGTK